MSLLIDSAVLDSAGLDSRAHRPEAAAEAPAPLDRAPVGGYSLGVVLPVAVLAGVAVGWAAFRAGQVAGPAGLVSTIVTSPGLVWPGLAGLVGALSRSRFTASITAVAALLTANFAFAGLLYSWLRDQGSQASFTSATGLWQWALLALVIGPVFGCAGWYCRAGSASGRAFAAGSIAGLAAAHGAFVLLQAIQFEGFGIGLASHSLTGPGRFAFALALVIPPLLWLLVRQRAGRLWLTLAAFAGSVTIGAMVWQFGVPLLFSAVS